MNKIIPAIVVLFLSFSLAYAVKIESCKSEGESDWDCHESDICICRISGDCTNGRLLVYEKDIRTLLCMPRIVNGYSDIDWDDCFSPIGEVKVRADCEEEQSSENTVNIVSGNGDGGNGGHNGGSRTTTTTTTTTTIPCNYVCQAMCMDDNNPPFCYKRIPHGTNSCPGSTICCESILTSCPEAGPGTTIPQDKTCPYECCIDMPGYEYQYCSSGFTCCDHLCKEKCEEGSGFNITKSLIFWIILASMIPIIAFLIFILRKKNDYNMPEY